MDEQIVDRLASILAYASERSKCAFGFDFRTAPKDSNPERFAILRCDSDDLTLVSAMRKWWVFENNRVCTADKWVLPHENHGGEFYLRCPTLKYSTDSNRIRYGLKLGPEWYGVRECDIASFFSDDFHSPATVFQTPNSVT